MVKAYDGALILADLLVLLLKVVYYAIEGFYRFFFPVDEKSVAGEIVLVTGAGHGIGKELALKYASLGATVVCWDINDVSNEETVTEIKKMGGAAAHGYKCDVSNRDEVMRVADKVKKEVGTVTILLNNAGIMPCRPFLEYTPQEIQKMFDINVMAHFWMLQAFLPDMLAKNHGHIVALSSMAGVIGLTNLVPYCATKFAVRGMMEAISEELRISSSCGGTNSNIKFTTIYPYMVDTGLCKKPKIKFPSLMAVVPPQEAAAHIVMAQRRNIPEMSIPSHWLGINYLLRNFPDKVPRSVKDFLDSGVAADD
ncbi:short-chain dehydrogenase/reductase family 16C member 6 [Phymastichus coffea]|uniref:short-chain dehydrogenase/reductase family 16C member 6 n=1 Tax=Phymastichus coffea TaxID=108790 RepID=UPI00273AEBA3|nr:short-chain dehydrogenase/reductase family 16C member 6 [Phymastichus coffea]XP_058795556.1 short-chain dehydrogenase/reductase family 16C member 6 [Phymastichus coffea]